MDYFKEIIKTDPVNHYFLLNKERLLKLKENISKEEIIELEVKLNYLNFKPYYTVMSKENSFGLNRHNYISLATYYWPNPDTPSGLPYILKDGYSNPEGELYDKDKLRETAFISYYQLLLYYLTDDKKYYYSVKRRLNVFFLYKDTYMFPNMNHGQLIKGKNLGRGIGIIDFSANMSYAIYLLKTLYNLNYIEEDFYYSMKKWLKKFLNWLKNSKIGLEEKATLNNHGTMYDFLLFILHDIFKEEADIKDLVYSFIEYRLKLQMSSDGSLPLELKRTKSKSYSLMGLKGMLDIATIVKDYGFDLYDLSWLEQNLNISLEKGISFILDNLIKEDKWPYSQVTYFDEVTMLPTAYEAINLGLLKKDYKKLKELNVIDDLLLILFVNLLKK